MKWARAWCGAEMGSGACVTFLKGAEVLCNSEMGLMSG